MIATDTLPKSKNKFVFDAPASDGDKEADGEKEAVVVLQTCRVVVL